MISPTIFACVRLRVFGRNCLKYHWGVLIKFFSFGSVAPSIVISPHVSLVVCTAAFTITGSPFWTVISTAPHWSLRRYSISFHSARSISTFTLSSGLCWSISTPFREKWTVLRNLSVNHLYHHQESFSLI